MTSLQSKTLYFLPKLINSRSALQAHLFGLYSLPRRSPFALESLSIRSQFTLTSLAIRPPLALQSLSVRCPFTLQSWPIHPSSARSNLDIWPDSNSNNPLHRIIQHLYPRTWSFTDELKRCTCAARTFRWEQLLPSCSRFQKLSHMQVSK